MWRVETRGLSKRYGTQLSLTDCTLQIPEGCVFGLLGPNGAGKSTLLRILLGFLRPSAGAAWLAGVDVLKQPRQARSHASYLPGDARLMRSLRGLEQLQLLSGLHPLGSLERSRAIADQLQLDLSRRIMFMSTGMRQKLAIASVLGCQAPIVVLDEPTANLDPDVRREVLGLIQQIRREGRTVVLSSHIFSDIDATCDQVAILQRGRVVAQQTMADVQQCHIVHAYWLGLSENSEKGAGAAPRPAEADVIDAYQVWLQQTRACPWVKFCHASPKGDLAKGERLSSQWHIELHLAGAPTSWLGWLQQQPVGVESIERGGIRAVYERYQLTEHVT